MSIRVARAEVRFPSHSRKEMQTRWHDAASMVQLATNFIWQHWLVWHAKNDSADKIRKHLNALAKWRETKTGDKPKCLVTAIPKEMNLYKALAKQFPQLHKRPMVLLLQSVSNKIKQRKAAKGSLSGWMAILLAHESLPSTTRHQPVPFDVQNSTVTYHEGDKNKFRLRVRIDRYQEQGKTVGTSHEDEVELYLGGRGGNSQRVIIGRVVDGTYKFAGSSLYYDRQNRKWFALICYDMGEPVEKIAGSDTAILRPARKHPWRLRVPNRTLRRGGAGRHVEAVRKQLLTQRWGRQEGYRHAGSANKGHGRERALQPIFRLSQRWKDFVKTCNHTLTKKLVDECVERGIARLIYIQPAGTRRDKMFLTNAGKIPNREDSTGWDWHQVQTMLAYKCQQAGIHFESRKSGSDDEPSSVRLPVVPKTDSGASKKVRGRKAVLVP